MEFISYNIHGLSHLAKDVLEHGPLDSFSAFPYENNMTFFREACRKPHKHLQQIVKRCAENNVVSQENENVDVFSGMVPGKPWRSILPPCFTRNCRQYQTLECPLFLVSVSGNDNTLMLLDCTICVVQNIVLFFMFSP